MVRGLSDICHYFYCQMIQNNVRTQVSESWPFASLVSLRSVYMFHWQATKNTVLFSEWLPCGVLSSWCYQNTERLQGVRSNMVCAWIPTTRPTDSYIGTILPLAEFKKLESDWNINTWLDTKGLKINHIIVHAELVTINDITYMREINLLGEDIYPLNAPTLL